MILRRLLARFDPEPPQRRLYRRIVEQSRQPAFYARLGVPDTVNGRFDMITLHAFLVMNRLRHEGSAEAAEFSQALFDEMFLDMDHNLREMGVADTSVGKHVRRMSEVFFGRVAAYREALDAGDEEALKDAFRRNIFEGKARPAALSALLAYVTAAERKLRDMPFSALRRGEVTFPPPPGADTEER
jgi:cytochrome b pre-mRNA-processing protein 3